MSINSANAVASPRPGIETRMGRPLRVPLTPQTLALFEAMQRLTGDGRFVFPSLRSAERAMSDNTLNGALRRLGYDKSEMTVHGFRAMACPILNESGKWHTDAIERQRGHCDSNAVRRACARAEYWDERGRMMHWWSDHLDLLKARSVQSARRPLVRR
jgi:integrase